MKTFLRADIRLDLTKENVSKVVYWGVGKGTFFYSIGSGRLSPYKVHYKLRVFLEDFSVGKFCNDVIARLGARTMRRARGAHTRSNLSARHILKNL